jgi:hypothetical protein
LGVISCEESIARIPEAWKCFPESGNRSVCIETKIEHVLISLNHDQGSLFKFVMRTIDSPHTTSPNRVIFGKNFCSKIEFFTQNREFCSKMEFKKKFRAKKHEKIAQIPVLLIHPVLVILKQRAIYYCSKLYSSLAPLFRIANFRWIILLTKWSKASPKPSMWQPIPKFSMSYLIALCYLIRTNCRSSWRTLICKCFSQTF